MSSPAKLFFHNEELNINPFFLFPGQGAQYQGMAIDFLESQSFKINREKLTRLFSVASEIAGKDMVSLLRNSGAEFLKRTDVSQPAITIANLAAASCLVENGIKPAGCAGFSLGEYAALAITGVITEEDCLELVTARGKAMQAVVDKMIADAGNASPGMAAVTGLDPVRIESLVTEWKSKDPVFGELFIANYNSPKQTVVSGSANALAKAENLFTEAGARNYIRLEVAGPFHSPFMKPAEEEFRPSLEKVKFNDPAIPLYSNVTGQRVLTGEEAKKLALKQITGAVRWTDTEAAIAGAGGIDICLETGPGRTLQRFWRDTGSKIICAAAGSASDISKIIAGL